jgi:hypothetical protein
MDNKMPAIFSSSFLKIIDLQLPQNPPNGALEAIK